MTGQKLGQSAMDGCAGREHGKGGHDEATFGAGPVNQSAGRRL
jgi:hypothetical protein